MTTPQTLREKLIAAAEGAMPGTMVFHQWAPGIADACLAVLAAEEVSEMVKGRVWEVWARDRIHKGLSADIGQCESLDAAFAAGVRAMLGLTTQTQKTKPGEGDEA